MMASGTNEREIKQMIAGFGGLRHPREQVYHQTRPTETVCYGHAQGWELRYHQLDSLPPMTRLREPEMDVPLHVSQHTLYRHEWAVKEWVTTEPPSFNVETETLTFHGYYRIHVFDVWLTEAEEAVREKGDVDGE